jgi:serine/threonine protein kinase
MFFRGQSIGKYRIVSSLGSGGFGSVYLAEDTWIDKKVAIKVPHKQHIDFSEMVKEPRLLASLNHPNIVTVLTAERIDDVCNAVDHAHGAGVIHRDLRPGNMLVSEHGLLKVTDFGTSRFLEIAAHGTTIIGSPPYMAPEQFNGKAVFASDVYSVGVTMYQMLTGALPYETPTPADLARLMRGELVTAPRVKNARISGAINDVVLRALSPDLSVRYARASELLQAVLDTRAPSAVRGARRTTPFVEGATEGVQAIQARLRARETPQPQFCWQCRKPLHARATRCPFCSEAQ